MGRPLDAALKVMINIKAMQHLTAKSPMPHVTQGTGSPMKAIVTNKLLSMSAATQLDVMGATHHAPVFRRRSNIVTSVKCDTRYATLEAIVTRRLLVTAEMGKANTKPTAKQKDVVRCQNVAGDHGAEFLDCPFGNIKWCVVRTVWKRRVLT
jgi:hypothetical protein